MRSACCSLTCRFCFLFLLSVRAFGSCFPFLLSVPAFRSRFLFLLFVPALWLPLSVPAYRSCLQFLVSVVAFGSCFPFLLAVPASCSCSLPPLHFGSCLGSCCCKIVRVCCFMFDVSFLVAHTHSFRQRCGLRRTASAGCPPPHLHTATPEDDRGEKA